MKRVLIFSLVQSALLILLGAVSALAWDLPDKVWVNNSMPPKYWEQSGGLTQQSGCSLQRYHLFRAGGTPQDTFRLAVICPRAGKFCVEVLENNQHPGALPIDCVRSVPEQAVNIAVSSILYGSASE